jgi:hypothetical protein
LRYTDPLGLYIFDKNTSQEQQDAFNNALEAARKNLTDYGAKYGTSSDEYKKAARALEAYGEKGEDNNVTIAFRDGEGAGRVEPGRSKRIVVSFDLAEAKNTTTFGSEIGHEGSHVADKRAWIDSGFAKGMDPTTYRTEFDAYTVTGFLDQARHVLNDPPGRASSNNTELPYAKLPGKNPYLPEKVDLWNSSWAAADIATNRGKGIDRVLSRPKNAGGLYGVTPTHQGRPAF